MQSAADLLNRADEPAHIEILTHLARDGNAVSFQPVGRVHVEHLKAGGVDDEPLADPTESPDHQGCKQGNDHQDRENRDGERQELRNSGLQPTLERPCDGDDE
jgi:hypothetical protein